MVMTAYREMSCACAMTSRTPKQIPKCSATITFIYFVSQSVGTKFFISFPLVVIPSEHASPVRTEESLTFIRETNERCLDCARHDKSSHFLPAFTICSNTRRYS